MPSGSTSSANYDLEKRKASEGIDEQLRLKRLKEGDRRGEKRALEHNDDDNDIEGDVDIQQVTERVDELVLEMQECVAGCSAEEGEANEVESFDLADA